MRKRFLAIVLFLLLPGAANAQVANHEDVVRAVNAAHPGLIQTSTQFTDEVCRQLVATTGDKGWGRKARSRGNEGSRNGDALAYILNGNDATKVLIDIVQASDTPDAKPQWTVYDGPNDGNGFWIPCPGGVVTPTPTPNPVPVPSADIEALKAQVADLQSKQQAMASVIAQLQNDVKDAQEKAGWANHEAIAANTTVGWLRDYLKAHPIPDGCRVQFLGCKPTFNYPPIQ